MTYATPAQISYIVSLARAKGMTKTEALADYGINPGEALTARLASEVIDHLKAARPENQTPTYLAAVEKAEADRAAFNAKYGF